MAQYKIKLKNANAIVGIDIEVVADKTKTMVIAFRDSDGDVHTLEVDGTLSVYQDARDKLTRELDAVKNYLSK